MKVKFLGEWCTVDLSGKYSNGRQAIELITEDGEPMAVATVNVPEVVLAKDEAIIKNYSENEGILKVLVNAGIVKDTGETVQTGMVTCPIVKILITHNESEVQDNATD
jgi:hypothetical protein